MAYVNLSSPRVIGNVAQNTGQFSLLGVGAAAVTSALYVNATNRIGAWVTGSNVSSGSDADGIFVDASFQPSVNITNAASIGLYPTMAPPGGVTITNGYGLYIASGTFAGAGTVTTGYGLFVTAPTIATTNITAQLDNIRLNSNTISATNANGTLTVVSAGVGALGIGTNATAHATTIGTTTASATLVLNAPAGGMTIGGFIEGAVVTSSTGVVSSVTGTAGFVLTANAAGTAPSFQAISASGAISSITGNSGGAEVPSSGNFNILGTGSITVAGSANTETVQLTGLTNHAVLIGAGTATITKVGPVASTGAFLASNGVGSDPGFSTATYPLTTTINQILYSSAANTVSGLSTANQGVLTTGTTGIPVITAIATNGQLIIGSTAGAPAAATLTAGAGISITNASNSITIATSGAGFTWTDVTGATQALSVANGYITDRGGGVTYTLPASAALGDEIQIIGKAGIATIAQNANQQISVATSNSTVGVTGTVVASDASDCITLICITSGASTVYRAHPASGNWVIT